MDSGAQQPLGTLRSVQGVDPIWTSEVFVSDDGVELFTAFLDDLSDAAFAAVDAAIQRILLVRGIGLAGSEWLKPVGGGLHEFRVRHSAEEIAHMFGGEPSSTSPTEPVLLRVFVHFHGHKVILLLSGYDKGDDPSRRRQQRAIADARQALRAWAGQQERKRARERRGGRRGGPGRGG